MAIRETPAVRGARRARQLRNRLATELADARRAAGLSLRVVASAIGVSVDTIRRLERGDASACTIDLVASVAAVVGLELGASLYRDGDPVRDRGHLALIDRLRKRLGQRARLRVEVPVPIAGDKRSGDAMLTVTAPDEGNVPGDVLFEAETHLDDLQLLERRGAAKQRDLSARRLVLVVADTRHNNEVIRQHPELRERFPIRPRAGLAALARGEDPGGDLLVVL